MTSRQAFNRLIMHQTEPRNRRFKDKLQQKKSRSVLLNPHSSRANAPPAHLGLRRRSINGLLLTSALCSLFAACSVLVLLIITVLFFAVLRNNGIKSAGRDPTNTEDMCLGSDGERVSLTPSRPVLFCFWTLININSTSGWSFHFMRSDYSLNACGGTKPN